jgi:hypothetical protein
MTARRLVLGGQVTIMGHNSRLTAQFDMTSNSSSLIQSSPSLLFFFLVFYVFLRTHVVLPDSKLERRATSKSKMGSSQSRELSKIDDASKQQHQPRKNDSDNGDANEESEGDNANTGGGCPMKQADGSYSYDWRALFRSPHAPGGSKPIQQDDVSQNKDGSLSTKNKKMKNDDQQVASKGGCPVKEYNVYSQPIDSTNNMPKVANQLPAPSQKQELSTERVQSNISKVSINSALPLFHSMFLGAWLIYCFFVVVCDVWFLT